nr:MAG TPA: hypothetical protein [Caudoviricetes sp.]
MYLNCDSFSHKFKLSCLILTKVVFKFAQQGLAEVEL